MLKNPQKKYCLARDYRVLEARRRQELLRLLHELYSIRALVVDENDIVSSEPMVRRNAPSLKEALAIAIDPIAWSRNTTVENSYIHHHQKRWHKQVLTRQAADASADANRDNSSKESS